MPILRLFSTSPGAGEGRPRVRLLPWLLAVAATAAVLLLSGRAVASEPSPKEDNLAKEHLLKAAFFYRFCQFARWPAGALPEAGGPFLIGVMGSKALVRAFERSFEDVKLKGRTVEVRRVEDLREADVVHALFASYWNSTPVWKMRRALRGRATLTVGDSEGFAPDGGMIGLVAVENKLRFDVNLVVARGAGFQFSSKMLSLARRVLK